VDLPQAAGETVLIGVDPAAVKLAQVPWQDAVGGRARR
jgi:hypothetical protein